MTPYVKAESLPQIDAFVAMERARLTEPERVRYDEYRLRYDNNPHDYALNDFPPCLQIEPTSICNYRCVFCYQTDAAWTESDQMGRMSLDVFRQAIDEAEGRCEAITLASRGEPLLHPQFADMLAYAAGKFVALKVNTNGWMLTERLCHAFLEADLLTLVISAEAIREPSYSELRVGGTLERVRANLSQLRRIQQVEYPHSRILIRVSGVQVPRAASLAEMQAYWGDVADQVCLVAYNPWENTYERPINEIMTPCSDLWRRMFLWWDGTVNPCDVDYRSLLSVGRFPLVSLADMWTGTPYEALRDAHLRKSRSSCSPCNHCTVV